MLTGSPHAGSVPVVLLLLLLLLLLLRLIVAEMRGRVNVGRLALRAGLSRQSLCTGSSRAAAGRVAFEADAGFALDLVGAHLAPLVPLLSPANVAHFHLAVTELDNCRRTPAHAHEARRAVNTH